ncbi:MAG: site-specific DNA-methyltransferase [Elusimicrobia bacterium]|nr:site-specific DNA-methyltransferase [Elusimicrobiota bacterium]
MPTLVYPGKIGIQELLANPQPAKVRRVWSSASHNRNGWENLLFFGENLGVLFHLLENPDVKGKVRLVYIDPPFSTRQEFKVGINGRTATISPSPNDSRAYVDSLQGASFIEFLRRRIILLRELLADNGSIYVHIDSKMGHYLKIVMDEVFGSRNFRNDITRIKCNPKNFARKGYGNIADTVLFYSKGDKFVWNEPRMRMDDEDLRRLFPKVAPDGRFYTTNPLHAPGETRNGATGGLWRGLRPPPGRHWRYPPEKLEQLAKRGLVEWSSTGNPRKIIFADEVAKRGKKVQDVWAYKDPPYPEYPTEKNPAMLEMIVRASSKPNDLVLDCFAGSGTTLLAAQRHNRRWIGVEQSSAALAVMRKRLGNERAGVPFDVFKTE